MRQFYANKLTEKLSELYDSHFYCSFSLTGSVVVALLHECMIHTGNPVC